MVNEVTLVRQSCMSTKSKAFSFILCDNESLITKTFLSYHVHRHTDRLEWQYFKTRKRFSEKPIVAFTNSTIFILDLYIMTKPVWFYGIAFSAWTLN